jgi:hypothetical protein
MVRAIVSRRFSWRLMIIGVCLGFPLGVVQEGWRSYPWLIVPLTLVSVIVLHPIMEKDVPSLIGPDMLSSPRLYVGLALLLTSGFVLFRWAVLNNRF